MLSIFTILQIVKFGRMIAEINKTSITIFTNVIIITTIAVSHREEIVMFVVKKQQKAKELWSQNREFRGNKGKHNIFLVDYKGDWDNDINDNNKKANHLDDNDGDKM